MTSVTFTSTGLQTADWAIVGGSLLLMLLLSLLAAFRMRNLTDYVVGGRRFGRLLLLFFACGSGTSSDQPGAVVAGTWRSGLAGLWWQFLWLPVTPFYWIAAPLLRRVRAITAADFFEVRFGPGTSILYSVYGMAICVVLMAGILFSSSRLLNSLTGNVADQLAAELQWAVPVVNLEVVLSPPAADRPPTVVWNQVTGDQLLVLAVSCAFMLCGFVGGLGAAVLTDVMQGLLTIAVTVILLPLTFRQIGGFGALHQSGSLKANMFDFVASQGATGPPNHEPFTPFYLATLSLAALSGVIVQPHIMSLCGAGRTELDSRIGFTFGSLLKRCLAVIWTLTGLACVAWYLGSSSPLLQSADPADAALYQQLTQAASSDSSQLSPEEQQALRRTDSQFADQLFGRAARLLLPAAGPGLLGLLMAAVLAAIISHCTTQMVTASGLFTENIYRRHLAPERSPRHYLWVSRLAGILVVLFALALQTTFVDIIDALRLMLKIPAAIGISMWLGLVWIRWNTPAVWTATLASTAMWVIAAYFPEEVLRTFPGTRELMFLETAGSLVMADAWQIVWYLSAGVVCGSICALLTDPQPADQLDHFYYLLRTRIRPNEQTELPCVVPDDADEPEPSLSLASFQFPAPTRTGVAGFLIAAAVVVAMVYGTKWLSQVI